MSYRDGPRRVRLSEWAHREGIARITAYRMLQRGILPVPTEQSPTGRWYVLLPPERLGKTVIYTRATPGPGQIESINRQVAALSEWAADRHRTVFTVVREIADPARHRLSRLERLLADPEITEILIDNPAVVGSGRLSLLTAALAPQGRAIVANSHKP